MPSMPMFTTPARSDHRPDKPASAMGTAAVMAASIAPEESRLFAPVTIRTSETTAIPAATTPSQAAGVQLARRPVGARRGRDVGVDPAHAATASGVCTARALATSLASSTNRYRRTNS